MTVTNVMVAFPSAPTVCCPELQILVAFFCLFVCFVLPQHVPLNHISSVLGILHCTSFPRAVFGLTWPNPHTLWLYKDMSLLPGFPSPLLKEFIKINLNLPCQCYLQWTCTSTQEVNMHLAFGRMFSACIRAATNLGSPVAAREAAPIKTVARQQPSKRTNKVIGWSCCPCCFSGEQNDAANKVSATLGQTTSSLTPWPRAQSSPSRQSRKNVQRLDFFYLSDKNINEWVLLCIIFYLTKKNAPVSSVVRLAAHQSWWRPLWSVCLFI